MFIYNLDSEKLLFLIISHYFINLINLFKFRVSNDIIFKIFNF